MGVTRSGLEQEVEQAMPLSTLASIQPNQGLKLLERLLLSPAPLALAQVRLLPRVHLHACSSHPGGARAAAVVHGAFAVIPSWRSMNRRDGRICPALAPLFVHSQG